MKKVLKLLRKELKAWNAEKTACNKFYERGKRFPKEYIKSIKNANSHIQELQAAILIINDYIDNKIDFYEKFKDSKLFKIT